MDGITPGGAPPDASQPTVVCPSCGTTVAKARFCGACGADLPAAAHAPTMEPLTGGSIGVPTEPTELPAELTDAAEGDLATEREAIVATPAPSGPLEAPDAAPVAGDGKACPWCGAISPPGASTCASCNATFPTPEGDEALERAARERIEAMQKEINNSKARGSAWWPFRPK
jgi:hypothetical protein